MKVRIIEVGPRDGLQNEKSPITTEQKLAFIRDLLASGLQEIEVTSFVSPKHVPQLADAAELWGMLPEGGKFSALVPNERGLERALEVGVGRIAVFTAASEAFVQQNIGMSIDESLSRFQTVIDRFKSERADGFVRGYVSTIVECPYAGRIGPSEVRRVVDRLFDLGCDEVSLGETIGVAVPSDLDGLLEAISDIGKERVVWHFHDTRGTAMMNIAHVYERGYRSFDSSAGGLGGCPYAPGAGGNVATEDLVYYCDRRGIETGVDLEKLAKASLPVLEANGHPVSAKSQAAVLAACGGLG